MEKDRLTIAFDIDDTSFAFHPRMVEEFNRELVGTGELTQVKHSLEIDYDFMRSFAVTPERYREIEYAYIHSEPHLTESPFSGLTENMAELRRRGHTVLLLTARPELYKEPTQKRIDKHLAGHGLDPETGLIMVGTPFVYEHEHIMTKGQAADIHDIDVLIDDSAEHCREMAEIGRVAILYGNYHWNRPATYRNRMFSAHNQQELIERLNWIEARFFGHGNAQ